MTATIIPYARQDLNQEDVDAVVMVLNSRFLTQGPTVPQFEEALAKKCKVKFSVAVNSATSALHIALLSLGVGHGDTVWTTPITFAATANAVLYCGGFVDFVDIDSRTYNLCPKKLREKLIKAKENNLALPKVVIPVHLSGQSCEMEEMHSLSLEYGFQIIEDASHAVGGFYKGNPIGTCKYSAITIFSFHPVKIITSAEGGLLLTNNQNLYSRLQQLRSHGISSDSAKFETMDEGEIWNYQQIDLGYNYRMSDVHAALGLSQLSRLDEFINKRVGIAEKYNLALNALPITLPWQHPDTKSAHHLYLIKLQLNKLKKTQKQIYRELNAAGILVNLHYIPVYRHPYYKKLGFSKNYCPEAEKYFTSALSLPMYPAMSDEDQSHVIEILNTVVK